MTDVKCPTCGAKPGQRCETASGRKRDDHAPRVDASVEAKKKAKAAARAPAPAPMPKQPKSPKGVHYTMIPRPETCSCGGTSFVSVGLYCHLAGGVPLIALWRCESCGVNTEVEG